MAQIDFDWKRMQEVFSLEGAYQSYYLSNEGHINHTFILEFIKDSGEKHNYVLQKINTHVFRNPDQLMHNVLGITSYLRSIVLQRGGDPERETLNVFFTNEEKPYYTDEEGQCWRCYNFIDNAYTCQSIENPRVFYNAAKAFGTFQCLLADYPSETLYETIPNFHNTASRYADLETAIAEDAAGRAASVGAEIAFARARKDDTGVLLALIADKKLPLRVTHNDTKLNNVMFDKDSGEGVCVVDLDTVMPGLSLYDFGDSIRFGTNTAAEDERDVSKVSLDLNLYEAYVQGYLGAAGKSLTAMEIQYLPFSAKLMTLECGMRFLTDYLGGDTYFRIAWENHNLVRCRTQFALVADMERKMGEMERITQEASKEFI